MIPEGEEDMSAVKADQERGMIERAESSSPFATSLLEQLRAKIQACVNADNLAYTHDSDTAYKPQVESGIALDDFVLEHGEDLLLALAPRSETAPKPVAWQAKHPGEIYEWFQIPKDVFDNKGHGAYEYRELYAAPSSAPSATRAPTDSRLIRIRQRIAQWQDEDEAEHCTMLFDVERIAHE